MIHDFMPARLTPSHAARWFVLKINRTSTIRPALASGRRAILRFPALTMKSMNTTTAAETVDTTAPATPETPDTPAEASSAADAAAVAPAADAPQADAPADAPAAAPAAAGAAPATSARALLKQM